MEAAGTLTCAASPASSSLTCIAANARAVPLALGLQLLPAGHGLNPLGVHLIVAPIAQCHKIAALKCVSDTAVDGADGMTRYVIGAAAAFHMEADETLTCAATPSSPSLSCVAHNSRAVPAALGLQLWPAAHPANTQRIDLVVAPLAQCQQVAAGTAGTCDTSVSVTGADGVARFVAGVATVLHMEATAAVVCS